MGKIPVSVAFGISAAHPIDRAGTNYQDPSDFGEVSFAADEANELASPSGQLDLWRMCENARSSGVKGRLSRDSDACVTSIDRGVRVEQGACQTGVSCFIDWVKDYRISYTGNFTEEDWYTQNLNDVLGSVGFTSYLAHMEQVRKRNGLPLPFSRSWFFMSESSLQWAYVSFNSTLDLEWMPLDKIQPHYDDWEAWVSSELSVLQGFQTCEMWGWMVTQREILKNVSSSIGVCLLFALAILCGATTNWVIACICVTCIVVILIVFALFITTLGLSLGIFEAVGLIVVVGLSVDYTVHVGHSYNECRYLDGKPASRIERTQHALTEMGISVVSGAATTLLASVFLLPTSFTFYYYFGIFMLSTVLLSLAVALTLLPTLLLTVGPEGSFGDIHVLRKLGEHASFCCSKGKHTPVDVFAGTRSA